MTELQECPFCLKMVERLPHLCQAESDSRLATLHSLAEDVISMSRELSGGSRTNMSPDLEAYTFNDLLPLFDKIESMNIALGSAMAAERSVRNRLEKAVCNIVIQDMLDVHLCCQRDPSLGGMDFDPEFIAYAKYHLQMDRPAYEKPPERFIKLAELIKAIGEIKENG